MTISEPEPVAPSEDIQAENLACEILRRDREPSAEALASCPESAWSALLESWVTAQLTPLVYSRLWQFDLTDHLPPAVLNELKTRKRYAALSSVLLGRQVQTLMADFASRDIPMMFLKGVLLSHKVYEHPEDRQMNDIDLLVRAEHLHAAVELLHSLGYHKRDEKALVETGGSWHEGGVSDFLGTTFRHVDLHTNPTHALAPALIWEKARTEELLGMETKVMSPTHLIVHLLHHSARHRRQEGGISMRHVIDIAETSTRFARDVDWQEVADRSRGKNRDEFVWRILRYCVTRLGAPIPRQITDEAGYARARDLMVATTLGATGADAGWLRWTMLPLRSEASLWAKVRYVAAMLFPRPEFMREKYNLRGNAALPLYYPLRLVAAAVHLIRLLFSRMFWRFVRGRDEDAPQQTG